MRHRQVTRLPATRLSVPLLAAFAALAAAPVGAQTLRIALRDDPDILDPTFSRTYVGTVAMTAICDKLFDMDEKLAIVPRLASGYEWADSRTLLIRLRPGVKFQDGEPLDAAAVKYSLERHVNTQGSFRRSEIGAIDHVEVADPLTARVVLKQPFYPLLGALTDRAGMMVSPKAAEAAGKEFGLHPVCAGPFRFVERVPQDHITLERFPEYWDKASVHFDRVTYRFMPDSSIRLTNLQAGAIDIAEVAPTDADAVRHDPKLRLVTAPSLGYGAITINLGEGAKADGPLGRDPRVRQAFSLSLDREGLSGVVFAGMYTPTAQAISAQSPFHAPEVAPPKHDVARARALLKEAGVALPVPVALTVPNTPQSLQAAEVIQAMAGEAGFAVSINAMEFGTALAAVQRGDFTASLGGWSGLLDADSNSWSMLHTGGALNMARYSNPAVDAALDGARTTEGVEARRAEYAAVWRQVSQDLPMIYLWTPRNIAGVSSRITGFTLLPDGLYRLQGVQPAQESAQR